MAHDHDDLSDITWADFLLFGGISLGFISVCVVLLVGLGGAILRTFTGS